MAKKNSANVRMDRITKRLARRLQKEKEEQLAYFRRPWADVHLVFSPCEKAIASLSLIKNTADFCRVASKARKQLVVAREKCSLLNDCRNHVANVHNIVQHAAKKIGDLRRELRSTIPDHVDSILVPCLHLHKELLAHAVHVPNDFAQELAKEETSPAEAKGKLQEHMVWAKETFLSLDKAILTASAQVWFGGVALATGPHMPLA